MNREIKFRALNSKNEIIYGLPYTDEVNETLYYKEFNNRLCWRDDKGRHCNQPYKNGTLQQYTGLKDKNGVEIYEGDIVKLWEGTFKEHIEEIMFKNGCFGIDCYRGVTPIQEIMEEESEYVDILEVIGNIYDNPELLTNKN